MNSTERIDYRFWLIDENDVKLYPVKIRNRSNGRINFRVAPGSTNITSKQIETEKLSDVIDAVVIDRHGLRVTSGPSRPINIRSLSGRIQGYDMEAGVATGRYRGPREKTENIK
jgi:hypothetical protein